MPARAAPHCSLKMSRTARRHGRHCITPVFETRLLRILLNCRLVLAVGFLTIPRPAERLHKTVYQYNQYNLLSRVLVRPLLDHTPPVAFYTGLRCISRSRWRGLGLCQWVQSQWIHVIVAVIASKTCQAAFIVPCPLFVMTFDHGVV